MEHKFLSHFFLLYYFTVEIFLHVQVTGKTSIGSELVEIVQQNVFETETLTL